MEKIKRFIELHVPVRSCTLRCDYCYITHNRLFDVGLPTLKYDAETVRIALSKERLGGTCLINFCGGGETLLPPEIPSYIRALLAEGHYVSVVTNATVDRAFDEISQFPSELQERLFFKFSYHYLQLKQHGLLDRFFLNIKKVVAAGASFTLEATPSDEWIPYIEEMKQLAIERVGAAPHISVARDEHDSSELPILTKLAKEDYRKVWKDAFDSKLFDVKLSFFNQKRTEFCYAGDWAFILNLGSGEMNQCYSSWYSQNIFEDIHAPINFLAMGHHCRLPHCYNAHAWIGLGVIPQINTPTYAEMRNRVCADGSEWLSPTVKDFFSQKMWNNNVQYSLCKKCKVDCEIEKIKIEQKLVPFNKSIKKMIKKILHYVNK